MVNEIKINGSNSKKLKDNDTKKDSSKASNKKKSQRKNNSRKKSEKSEDSKISGLFRSKSEKVLKKSSKENLKTSFPDENSEKFFIYKDKALDTKLKSIYTVKKLDRTNAIRTLFENITVYDILPTSSRVLILDSEIKLGKSFNLMIQYEVPVAVVWSKDKFDFSDVFGTSDFMHVIQAFYKKASKDQTIKELDSWDIKEWKNFRSKDHKLITVNGVHRVNVVIKLLVSNSLHQVVVLNKNNGDVLYLLNQKNIIEYFYHYLPKLPKPEYLNKTLEDLNIGSYWNVISAFITDNLYDVLMKMLENGFSSIPILDKRHNIIGVYTREDVYGLIDRSEFSLLKGTVETAMKQCARPFAGVISCRKNDTFLTVISKIVTERRHSLLVLNAQAQMVGIVTTSDILEYLNRELV